MSRIRKRALLGLLALAFTSACQGSFGLTSRIEAPQLVSPPDGAQVECVVLPAPTPTPSPAPSPTPTPSPTPQFFFTWTAVQGVDAYVLEIYAAADGRLVANPRLGPGETRALTLLCGRDYLWRVAAIATYPAAPAFSGFRRFTLLSVTTASAEGMIFVRAP